MLKAGCTTSQYGTKQMRNGGQVGQIVFRWSLVTVELDARDIADDLALHI